MRAWSGGAAGETPCAADHAGTEKAATEMRDRKMVARRREGRVENIRKCYQPNEREQGLIMQGRAWRRRYSGFMSHEGKHCCSTVWS